MGLPKLSLAALVLLIGARQLAAAARSEQQPQQASIIRSEEGVQGSGKTLNTYYFDATKPEIKLSSAASPRPERTALTIKLASSSSVGRFMPVVTPRASGMTHSVSNTWQALKNLASMFVSLKPINSQASPNTPHLFPRAAMAVSAASNSAPTHLDIASAIALAEASGRRSSWAEVTPSSVLLLPYGGSAAAVADLMDVTYDAQSDSVTLQVDVVHHPDTVSEFTPHAPQTLAVDAAHYHFDTAPGVRVDAQALLDSLAGAGAGMAGMHFFVKGVLLDPVDPQPGDFSYPDFLKCLLPKLSVSSTQASIGTRLQASVSLQEFDPECLCRLFEDEGCCLSQGVCNDANNGCMGNLDDWCCAGSSACGQDECSGYPEPIRREECQEQKRKQSGPGAKVTPVTQDTAHTSTGANAKPGQVGTNSSRTHLGEYPFRSFPGGLPIELSISGGGQWVPTEPQPLAAGGRRRSGKRQSGNTSNLTTYTTILLNASGVGEAIFQVTGPDSIVINLSQVGFQPLQVLPAALIVNRVYAPAAKLKLIPSKAYRRCHDPVTLSALATDASGASVAGAKVAFSAFGDCHPDIDQTVKTTGANGIATITLNSHVPGVESVVAAGVDTSGAPVMSIAAHVHFYVERHHAEDREREYYNNGDDERYAKAAAQAAQELVQQAA